MPHRGIFYGFIGFIFANAMLHFMSVFLIWTPAYYFDSALKVLTAFVSITMAVVLICFLPQSVPLKESPKLERGPIEKEARDNQAFLDSIVENIPDMIFVKDARELRFVRFNKAGEELLGYLRADLIGKNDTDFFPKEEADFFALKDKQVLEGRKLVDIPEEPIHTRYKGKRILHTKKIPILDENNNPIYLLGISEDVTDSKEKEAALFQKNIELARAQAEREQLELFTYAASHDLKEPLQKIIGFSDLLKMQAGGKLDDAMSDSVERIQSGALRMNRLFEDLVQFSRVTIQNYNYAPVELQVVLAEVLSDLDTRIRSVKATIEVDKLPLVYADRTQMYVLFHNLISNALKFTANSKIPCVHVRSSPIKNDRVEIAVEDNGIGFDEKYLEKIFKPFERLHSREEYEGSGIGLAICQKIVSNHGGVILAKSTPGKGSIFKVQLPAKEHP